MQSYWCLGKVMWGRSGGRDHGREEQADSRIRGGGFPGLHLCHGKSICKPTPDRTVLEATTAGTYTWVVQSQASCSH